MGATLVPGGGATFRTWAPSARDVFLVLGEAARGAAARADWQPDPADRMTPLGDGTWAGFAPGVSDGAPYLFWIRGPADGTEGLKRDPYARELGAPPQYADFPNCPCLVREAHGYPWHDGGWRPPAFRDLMIYQLHVGVFWAVDDQGSDMRHRYGRFLDTVEKIPYLRELGVNAIQPLPIQEYDGDFGLGYAGLDYFSPEMTFQVEDPAELRHHLGVVNAMLAQAVQPLLSIADLAPGPNQLKCLVDLCHLNGIAVIFDLVYNHAGGGFDGRSVFYYDRQREGDDNRSLYFTDKGWAGGKVFAYWQAPVRQFLIDNARFFLDECRIDGIRYDEISVATAHGGDDFCRDLAATVRYHRPQAVQIAEYWHNDRDRAVRPTSQGGGLGFDAALADGLRDALRAALGQAAGGAAAQVSLDRVRDALHPPAGFPDAWRAVQHIENHDVVRWDYDRQVPRAPRVPALADPSNPRSWYARARSRVATALLLAAPGIPMLFMGQEFLEDKPWHDDVANWSRFLIWWDGLAGADRHMADFRRCVADLLRLRRAEPALRGDGVRVPQVHERDRVLVLHRWVEGEGRDVVLVASLNESVLEGYPIEMPWAGRWREAFNSDAFDHFPNPWVVGNGGYVRADGPPGRIYPHTARLRIPAIGALALVREG